MKIWLFMGYLFGYFWAIVCKNGWFIFRSHVIRCVTKNFYCYMQSRNRKNENFAHQLTFWHRGILGAHISIKVLRIFDVRTKSMTQTNHPLKKSAIFANNGPKVAKKYPIISQIFNFPISALYMSVKSICYASIEMRTKFITKSNHSLKKISLFFKKKYPIRSQIFNFLISALHM